MLFDRDLENMECMVISVFISLVMSLVGDIWAEVPFIVSIREFNLSKRFRFLENQKTLYKNNEYYWGN